MRRKTIVFVLIAALLVATGGVSIWAGGSQEEASGPIVIRATQENAPTHPVGIGFERFKELLESRSNGEFRVNVYHSAALGSQREMVEGTQLNTIQVAAVPAGYMASFSPVHDIFSMPFLFRDIEHFVNVINGPLMDEMEGSLAEIGLYPLGYSTSGYRQIYANRPIERLEDMQGLRIRVMEVETIVDTIEALGAQPVPIGFGEVYTALQTGTVDGGETSIISWYASSHHEVAPYLAKVNYMDSGRVYFANQEFMDSLTEAQRTMVREAMRDAIADINELYEEQQNEVENEIVPTLDGVRITTPDLDPFREAAMAVYENNPPTLGMEWIQRIRDTQ